MKTRKVWLLLASAALVVGMDLPEGCGGPAVPESWKERAVEKSRSYGSEYCRNLQQNSKIGNGSLEDVWKARYEYRKNCR